MAAAVERWWRRTAKRLAHVARESSRACGLPSRAGGVLSSCAACDVRQENVLPPPSPQVCDGCVGLVLSITGGTALHSELRHERSGESTVGLDETVAPQGNELGVTSSSSGITYTGVGTSTDIIVASARAYVTAINRMIEREEKAPARKAAAQ